MYPSNKKKKVWREEKGNQPVESWGVRAVGVGVGAGVRQCVPRRPPLELPPRALRPVPPPSGVGVYTRAHPCAPRCARAAPRHLPLAHVWAHAPFYLQPRPVTFCLGGAALASQAVWNPLYPWRGTSFCESQLGLWHPWLGCPTDKCPLTGTQAALPLRLGAPEPSFIPSSALSFLHPRLVKSPHFQVFIPFLGPLPQLQCDF